VRDDITVAAGQETTVRFSLAIGKSVTAIGVTARAMTAEIETIVPIRARTSDTASLIGGLSGLDVYSGGGVSSLPVIHGMADDRVNVLINGMSLASACSMHMNPPLSYIDPASVGSVSVMAGITPVSRGGDSIGGTIAVESEAPEFAMPGQDVVVHGGLSAFHRTNGVGNGGSARVSAATENFSIGYVGSYVNANDYKDGSGAIVQSTFYEAQNHALELAARHGNNLITLDIGYQHIPQQGFVNAFLDMKSNEGKFVNLHYEGVFARMRLDARVYYENTTHMMDILRDKVPGTEFPINTNGTNLGYSIELEKPISARDTVRIGTELRRFSLNDWWTPTSNMEGVQGPNTLTNIHNGTRDRFGTYVEWESRRGKGWTELIGIRSDVVRMNTGNVAGYNSDPTATGGASYYADATAFNSLDHHRLDSNFDITAQARYEPKPTFTFEFGYARKTRSPSLYERYLWVKRSFEAASMNGWFGDGNAYTGNINLRPEVAHTLSATAGWHDAAKKGWELKVTPYFTRVQNYIDVIRCPVIADGSDGCTAANATANSGFVTLQFANQAARLYGVDALVRAPLGGNAKFGRFGLTGTLGYVHGTNLVTGDNLYHMMPVHGDLALEHRRGNWSSALDFQAVDAKTDVEAVRIELPTAGYALLNLRSGYRWKLSERVGFRLDVGIDNLTNRLYDLPLGGRYWADPNGATSVPGMGRSFYTGTTFEF
jgi:iron complex outermembrane receptor protein